MICYMVISMNQDCLNHPGRVRKLKVRFHIQVATPGLMAPAKIIEFILEYDNYLHATDPYLTKIITKLSILTFPIDKVPT